MGSAAVGSTGQHTWQNTLRSCCTSSVLALHKGPRGAPSGPANCRHARMRLTARLTPSALQDRPRRAPAGRCGWPPSARRRAPRSFDGTAPECGEPDAAPQSCAAPRGAAARACHLRPQPSWPSLRRARRRAGGRAARQKSVKSHAPMTGVPCCKPAACQPASQQPGPQLPKPNQRRAQSTSLPHQGEHASMVAAHPPAGWVWAAARKAGG